MHHAETRASLLTAGTVALTSHLSHIISYLVIPIKVARLFGYARNNSECFLLVRISPRTIGKYTTNMIIYQTFSKKSTKEGLYEGGGMVFCINR